MRENIKRKEIKPENSLLVSRVFSSLSKKDQETCRKIFKRKKFSEDDKLSIINSIHHKLPKPFCLIPEKDRINTARKILKTKGDVKFHPVRVIPDEEYLLEAQNKARTIKDAFDLLSEDDKIRWARYANLILDISTINLSRRWNLLDWEHSVVNFAMKYACVMIGIPAFSDVFESDYWIVFRIEKYHRGMLEDERKTYDNMVLDYLEPKNKKTIAIISATKAVNKLSYSMKNKGVYGYFKIKSKELNPTQKFRLAVKLLLAPKNTLRTK